MIKKTGLSLMSIILTLFLTLTLIAMGVVYYWYSNAAVFGATMTPAQQQPYTSSKNLVETQFVNQTDTSTEQSFEFMASALWDYITADDLAPKRNIDVITADLSN